MLVHVRIVFALKTLSIDGRQKVIGKVLELDRSLEDTLPYIFALLGIAEGDDPLAQMDAQIQRRDYVKEYSGSPFLFG